MTNDTIDKDSRLKERLSDAADTVKRAFAEFLTFPTLIIIVFLLSAVISYTLDREEFPALQPVRFFLKSHIFADAQATSGLLSAVAAGIIAVTSITITLLLIVAQQSAASMTSQVFDQFLRRRANQLYFGFFVGLALYSLITLATVNAPFNPVFGGTLAFLLTAIALYMLIILLYTTINQMRPVEIIEAIHEHVLNSRERQSEMLRCTRRSSIFEGKVAEAVKCEMHGYINRIDFKKIYTAIQSANIEAEVVMKVSIGSYVAFKDTIAEVKAADNATAAIIGKAVVRAIHIDRQRDIATDTAYGIEQMEMIAWTSISTAKSNPAPGLLTIRSLRDVLSRWSIEKTNENCEHEGGGEIFPIVYYDDTPAKLLDAFETFAVASSESMQHQTYIEVVLTFTSVFERLPIEWRNRVEDVILRILSVLGDHVLTAEMDSALLGLIDELRFAGCHETAAAVETARAKLQLSVGNLNSRSTRATAEK